MMGPQKCVREIHGKHYFRNNYKRICGHPHRNVMISLCFRLTFVISFMFIFYRSVMS